MRLATIHTSALCQLQTYYLAGTGLIQINDDDNDRHDISFQLRGVTALPPLDDREYLNFWQHLYINSRISLAGLPAEP